MCWRDVDEHLLLYASHQQWVYQVPQQMAPNSDAPVDKTTFYQRRS